MTLNQRRITVKAGFTIIMAMLSICMIFPFLWMLSASFKPDSEVFNFPIEWIPKHITFDNYKKIWFSDLNFSRFLFNSCKVTVLSVLGDVCREHESGVVHFQEVIHGLTISSQQNTSITELP